MLNLKASMANCSTIKFTNGSGDELAAGALYKVEDLVGQVVKTTADGEEGVLIFRAPSPGTLLPCPTDSTGVFSAGDAVYYDSAAGKVVNSTDKTDNIFCGYAVEAAAQSDETVLVDLDGAAARGEAES